MKHTLSAADDTIITEHFQSKAEHILLTFEPIEQPTEDITINVFVMDNHLDIGLAVDTCPTTDLSASNASITIPSGTTAPLGFLVKFPYPTQLKVQMVTNDVPFNFYTTMLGLIG